MDSVWVSIIAKDSDRKTYCLSDRWSNILATIQDLSPSHESDEILVVTVADACVYSSLMAPEAIAWTDLCEFLA